MERYTFAMKIREGSKGNYCQKLGEIWSDLTAFLDRNYIKNFSIWLVEDLIFGYCEKMGTHSLSKEEQTIRKQLICAMEDTFEWISEPDQNMELMYQDFGIVRENKELIRHRVFMIKLHEGCEQEYKHRHDQLIEKKGNRINEGPDSNFSIWSAKGYVFGYDEIDVTMEHDLTEYERTQTVAWETKQLEIMDWITNDVDWMTGQVHPSIMRIAWHN